MVLKALRTQGALDLRTADSVEHVLPPPDGLCVLEDENFPFEVISDIAEAESRRKEINRRPYHIRRW